MSLFGMDHSTFWNSLFRWSIYAPCPFWMPMVFAPHWKYTKKMAQNFFLPVIAYSLIYVYVIIAHWDKVRLQFFVCVF